MKAHLAVLLFASATIASGAASARSDGDTPPDGTPPPVEGSFDALSPGNQKIVNAIHEAQFGSPNETNGGALLSRDEIAAMKAGTGWGKLYKQLYRRGYTTERNLGQAVSKYNHQPPPQPETGVVITTATGASYSAGDARGGRHGGTRGRKAKGVTASGGGVTGGAGYGGGRGFGHGRRTVVTSGAGAAITAGPAGHSSAGGGGHGRGGSNKLE